MALDAVLKLSLLISSLAWAWILTCAHGRAALLRTFGWIESVLNGWWTFLGWLNSHFHFGKFEGTE